VQGGAFGVPTVIDDEVIRAIEAGERLAPLHNRPALDGIRASREELPDIPMVAIFDTTFHNAMPPYASHYALPQELTLKHGLRRYGYHGIAHRSMTERYAELAGAEMEDVSIITLQLGNGCSATAVRNGASIDTSMGFTPLEGLIMGTRPGDVDPGALSYLLGAAGVSAGELDDILNHHSGLLGISGTSGDMAALLEEEAQGHPRAHDAIEMFCYRVRKYIGAYVAVLGGADAIVFGGGIGERSPEIRRRICEPLESLGVRIDAERNAALTGAEGRFSGEGSLLAAWAIKSDEERVIATDTYELLVRMRRGRDT
jgi:acetate kinase